MSKGAIGYSVKWEVECAEPECTVRAKGDRARAATTLKSQGWRLPYKSVPYGWRCPQHAEGYKTH